MPKQTFFNIAEEKRNNILEAAIKEFSECDFEEASINKIIKLAKIPRGSFYQYFEDKSDLFEHVVFFLRKKEIEKIIHNFNENTDREFFDIIRSFFIADLNYLRDSEYKSIFLNYIKYIYAYKYGILEDSLLNPDYSFNTNIVETIYKDLIEKHYDISIAEFKDIFEICMQILQQTLVKYGIEKLSYDESIESFERRIGIINKGLKK